MTIFQSVRKISNKILKIKINYYENFSLKVHVQNPCLIIISEIYFPLIARKRRLTVIFQNYALFKVKTPFFFTNHHYYIYNEFRNLFHIFRSTENTIFENCLRTALSEFKFEFDLDINQNLKIKIQIFLF